MASIAQSEPLFLASLLRRITLRKARVNLTQPKEYRLDIMEIGARGLLGWQQNVLRLPPAT
jgi:hypothetical protein